VFDRSIAIFRQGDGSNVERVKEIAKQLEFVGVGQLVAHGSEPRSLL
jgi:hypothetical protein